MELNNKNLVSISSDKSIIFYFKDNLKYQLDYKIATKGSCNSIIKTKENEICYSERDKDTYNICFYDLNENKIKSSLGNIKCGQRFFRTFNMITKDLLIIL